MSNGPDAAGGGYAWIGEMVSQGIDDVSGVIQSFIEGVGHDPCVRMVTNQVTIADYEATQQDLEGYAAEAATAIAQARNFTFQSWGEDTAAAGVYPFVDVLYDAGARPPDEEDVSAAAVVLAIFTLGIGSIFAAADQRENWSARLYRSLPPPAHSPPGTNNGFRLAAGIYFWAGRDHSQEYHLEHGMLSGWRARELYWAWYNGVLSSVGPTAWPDWAGDMAYVTGDANWKVGDPVGGQLGYLRDLVEELRVYQLQTVAACDEQTEWERQLVEESLDAPRDAAKRRDTMMAVLAGIALIALTGKNK